MVVSRRHAHERCIVVYPVVLMLNVVITVTKRHAHELKSVGRLRWRVAKDCVRILKVNQKPNGVNEDHSVQKGDSYMTLSGLETELVTTTPLPKLQHFVKNSPSQCYINVSCVLGFTRLENGRMGFIFMSNHI
ncbi:hypothetical protein CMV_002036 [Castanea mollissima]|uniref:Uncharacterized protein n=1 Tax=Castanea mollissima TaxID=60419 RepID=A0A8J4S217_9ROSI|nr:hypothetical protein CMV_002036 [Castanea mollissima]